MACGFKPTEGTPCPQEATHEATFPLRNTGWTRTIPYCQEHALNAERQGSTITETDEPRPPHARKKD